MCFFFKKFDWSFECYKARVVGGGAGQQTGIDYSETISPIVKLAVLSKS